MGETALALVGQPSQPERPHLAQILRALAEPNRLRILRHLLEGELSEKVLVARLCISQPRVARHLAYLKRAGILSVRRLGRYAIWSVNFQDNRIRRLLGTLVELFQWERARA